MDVPVMGQELFEDLIRDGERQGELRQARAWLLEAFSARFEDPPSAVREAVGTTGDVEQLSRWHRAVVRAPDAATATAAILGPR